jgi:hypothetical protein
MLNEHYPSTSMVEGIVVVIVGSGGGDAAAVVVSRSWLIVHKPTNYYFNFVHSLPVNAEVAF